MLKNSGLLFGRYFLYLRILFLSDYHFLFRLLFFYSAYASSPGYITYGGGCHFMIAVGVKEGC